MHVVLLPALPFDGRMWETTRSWLPDASAPALLGRGGSIREWAESVLDELPCNDLLLVGSSVGGSCALEMARAAPGRVSGLVLIGAKADVRRDRAARDEAVAVLQDEGSKAHGSVTGNPCSASIAMQRSWQQPTRSLLGRTSTISPPVCALSMIGVIIESSYRVGRSRWC